MSAEFTLPVSFFTLEPGTPVVGRFGEPVGTVEQVLIAYGEHFDGIVVSTRTGSRFVDAPEVRSITRARVRVGGDRVEATDEDRAAVVAGLTHAFAGDRLGVEALERRIDLAHRATRISELDELVADLL